MIYQPVTDNICQATQYAAPQYPLNSIFQPWCQKTKRSDIRKSYSVGGRWRLVLQKGNELKAVPCLLGIPLRLADNRHFLPISTRNTSSSYVQINYKKKWVFINWVPHTSFSSSYYSRTHAIASEAAVAIRKPRGWVKTSKWCRGMSRWLLSRSGNVQVGAGEERKQEECIHRIPVVQTLSSSLYIKKCLAVPHVCLGLPDLTHSLQTQTETQYDCAAFKLSVYTHGCVPNGVWHGENR